MWYFDEIKVSESWWSAFVISAKKIALNFEHGP